MFGRRTTMVLGSTLFLVILASAALWGTKGGQPVNSARPAATNSFSSTPRPLLSGNGFLDSASGLSLSGFLEALAPKPSATPPPVTSLKDVANMVVPKVSGAPPATLPVLTLPEISNAELAIDASGVATISDYIQYFNSHYADISFSGQRFTTVLKDENGIILFIPDLVEKVLASGNFSQIHDSLLVGKDYATAKINFLKSIKVTGDAIALNKKMIGFDRLLIELADKALAVQAGTATKNELADFHARFLATANDEQKKMLVQSGVLSSNAPKTFFMQVLGMLGLATPAVAIGDVPFGGMITLPIFCSCNLGYWVVVGPPVPASLFVPVSFIASPLFYSHKSLRPGAWWLGLYSPVPVPCLQGAPPTCIPAGVGSLILMSGTST